VTLLPVFKKLTRKEQAVSVFPKGRPSPPEATNNVPSVSANHLFILFIYLLCFASKHHTTIALKKLGHHNSLTPITVGPLQNININIENRIN
jgi:hypothetical protein